MIYIRRTFFLDVKDENLDKGEMKKLVLLLEEQSMHIRFSGSIELIEYINLIIIANDKNNERKIGSELF